MSKHKLLILLMVLPLLGLSCISIKTKTDEAQVADDGGFYILEKNRNDDYFWTQKVDVATTSTQKLNFKQEDVLAMVKDPQDDKAFYIGTIKAGLYYTYDGGENWNSAEKFKKSRINAIGISYKNKCLIYIAPGSELYKSEDCNRSWTRMYNETRATDGYYISALAVDPYNEGVLYMGINVDADKNEKEKGQGEVIKSVDFGQSWQPDRQLRVANGSIISKILINPNDSRIVYVATNNVGIYKTINGGERWENITGVKQDTPKEQSKEAENFTQRFEKLIDFTTDIDSKNIRDSLAFRDMEIVPGEKDSIIHASNYGLLHSDDGGSTWKEIKLIPPAGEVKAIIYSLAVHPTNSKEFYYGTDDTLFKTVDYGQGWTTIKGPGSRAIYHIIATANDSGDTNVYIGMYNIKPPAAQKK